MIVQRELEFRILYDLDDDWMSFGGFLAIVAEFRGMDTPPDEVAETIRWFAETGLVALGALSDNEYGWEAWNVGLDEAMKRIANGSTSGRGYKQAAGVAELMTTEVFRANITEKGGCRLAELEKQGLTYWTTLGPFRSTRG
ncbi:hypothetical protein [Rhodococcoides corynebacterioides]|uniref:hypothetical protein n=1 Tax=Rhodococcoides corynebacterioides TaxID=53972 RepID=UPI001C9B5DBF|nr:hypothetical protein [Rhodococcus corynebacterioides]MBY6350828.1 hypothetical protein [Rhodococcus corynebacterioides]